MSCMTMNPMRTYTRPATRYPARGDWQPKTGWEFADGFHKRLWRSPSTGRTRTAYVERSQGGWRFRVTERSVRGTVTQVAISRNDAIKPLARMCYGAADLAAVTR